MSNVQAFVAVPASGLKWENISNELWREYVFPSGAVVRIDAPFELAVKRGEKGDSHRVKAYDTAGKPVSYYIPPGWVALRWTGIDGSHAFNF